MTKINSTDAESIENSFLSSQLGEIMRKKLKKTFQLEFSQLQDLMMAVLKNSKNDSQDESSQGSSKQP